MKKVLVVDDTQVVRTVLVAFLKRYGVEVKEATDGRQGLELARSFRPDLLLLDVEMPEMDGIDVLRELRAEEATRATPVIMVTAQSAKETVIEILKQGVSGYLIKPATRSTFDKEVSKVLGEPSATAGAPTAGAAAAQPAAAASAPASEAPATAEPRPVLVVDDAQRVVEAMRAALESRYRVLTAGGGREALAIYERERPGVVVIDLVMPDMDGVETLAAMKALDVPGTRWIALSLRGDDGAADLARRGGFQAVVYKPLQANELLAAVQAGMPATSGDDDGTGLDWVEGCPVIVIPDPDAAAFTRFARDLTRTVRDLGEEGHDRLVVDLAAIREVTPTIARILVSLMTQAKSRGIRTAVCAPREELTRGLNAINETRSAKVGATREAALAGLG